MLRKVFSTQWVLVLLAGCAVAVTGCPTVPSGDLADTGGAVGDPCETAAGCDEGLVCEMGECAEPAAAGCETNEDCAEGEVCEGGECVAAPEDECEADEDCAEGEVCEEGECVAAPEDGADGAALYADNCAGCHGAGGTGGFAPEVAGYSADDLATGLESASHGGVAELSADEIAAIAEFLGG